MLRLGEECSKLASLQCIDWSQLEQSKVLITGATGLIGSFLVKTLMGRNANHGASISVIAPVRSKEKAYSVFSDYLADEGLILPEIHDLSDITTESMGAADYVIHAACPTSSMFFQQHPVETIYSIVSGTDAVLDYAKDSKAKSVVAISSMEVYGTGNSHAGINPKLSSHDIGRVDPLDVRSCYPEGKKAAECLCVAYSSEYHVPVKIARLAQTFGPGVSADDKRVFMYFAQCAVRGENIHLRTSGQSTRMYCHTADAVSALLIILLKGASGVAYNVANKATYISVIDLAKFVARKFASRPIEVVVDIDPNAPFPPEHHLPLDTSALERLGWSASYSLHDMFSSVIECLCRENR